MTCAALREEITDLQGYLAGLPAELAEGPYGATYRARLDALIQEAREEELKATAVVNALPAMDLRVWGESIAREHRVPAELLGELLKRWQGLFWALGQAASGRPTYRGLIPEHILRETSLEVTAFAPGSFVARLVLNEPPQPSLPETSTLGIAAFEAFERLCSAGAEHHELSLVLHDLQGRVMSAYAKLLNLLNDWDASLDFALAEPSDREIRRLQLPIGKVRTVLPMLGELAIPTKLDEQISLGILNAANRRTRTFEVDLGEEGTLTGRVDEKVSIDGITIGGRYRFQLAQMQTTDPLTGRTDETWVLLGATPVPRSYPAGAGEPSSE